MEKLRIGIIGFGNRGFSFARTLQTERFRNRAEVAAVYEPQPLKQEFARQACRNPVKICPSLEDFLNEKLDLVMVTTPQFAHAESAIASLHAGFDTFCDKPMARSAAECRAMIDAEKASSGTLFMGFNLRSHPVVSKIRELISAGRAGKIQQQNCIDNFSNGYTYFRRWHRFAKNSGGLTVEKGTHSIDLMNWFSGSDPLRVSAFGGLDRFTALPDASEYCRECSRKKTCEYYFDLEKVREQVSLDTGIDESYVNGGVRCDICPFNTEKDTYDNMSVLIEYENGCRAALMECFTSSVRQYNDREFMINGWDGQIWASLNRRTVHFYRNAPGRSAAPFEDLPVPEVAGHHGGADPMMLDYMFDCILKKLPNTRMPSRAGYYAVAVAEAAEQAVKERRIMEILPLETMEK